MEQAARTTLKSYTLTMNGADTGNRQDHDYYPTPPEVTRALMGFLKLPACTVWEPACGGGAMSRELEAAGHRVTSSDIRQCGYGDGGVDFLAAEPRPCDAIITNSPFELAEAFIRKSLATAPVVAMVLKSQFWHAKKRAPLFLDHPPAWVLPLTWRPDFLKGGKGSPTLDCLWTVWLPGVTDTRYRPLMKPGAPGLFEAA